MNEIVQVGDRVEVHGDIATDHCSVKTGIVTKTLFKGGLPMAAVEFDEPLMRGAGELKFGYGHSCAGCCKSGRGRYIELRHLSLIDSYEVDDSEDLTEALEILIKGEFD